MLERFALVLAFALLSSACREAKSGEPCSKNEACRSRVCFRFQERDQQFCSRLCYGDGDCPRGMVCLAGYDRCVPRRGKDVGESCQRQLECANGICIRVADPTTKAESAYCSKMCRRDADCPTPFRCRSREFKLRTGRVVLKNYCSRKPDKPKPKPQPQPKPQPKPLKPPTRINL